MDTSSAIDSIDIALLIRNVFRALPLKGFFIFIGVVVLFWCLFKVWLFMRDVGR